MIFFSHRCSRNNYESTYSVGTRCLNSDVLSFHWSPVECEYAETGTGGKPSVEVTLCGNTLLREANASEEAEMGLAEDEPLLHESRGLPRSPGEVGKLEGRQLINATNPSLKDRT